MSSCRPLSHQISRILLGGTCVAFFLLALISGYRQYELQHEEFCHVMQSQMGMAKSLIEAQITQHDRRISEIIDRLSLESEQSFLNFIAAKLIPYDPADIYYVLDPFQRIVFINGADQAFLGLDCSHLDHVASGQRISRVFQSLFSKRTVVSIQYPMAQGYTLFYERDVQNILPVLSHLEKAKIYPGQELFVLSSEGTVVYHADTSLVTSRHNLAFDLKNVSRVGKSHEHFRYAYFGKQYDAYMEELALPHGWSVYVHVRSDIIRQSILKAIALQLVFLLLFFSGLIFGLQFFLRRSFSQPVQKIVSSLSKYGTGCNGKVIETGISGNINELVEIGDAVNRMAQEAASANERIRASEEHIRLLINSVSEAIYGMDTAGRCMFCNASFLNLLGYDSEDEVLGRNIHNLIHHHKAEGSHYPESECFAHKGVSLGSPTYSELEIFFRKDGSTFPSECWCHPIRKDGIVTGAVITFFDISKSIAVENALQESERKYRTLIETTDTGFVIVNSRGDVLDANQVYVRVTGHDNLKQIVGRSVLEWTAPYDRDRNIEEVKKCYALGQVRDLEIDYVTAAGNITPVEINATLIEQDGEQIVLALIRDISERRQAARELASQKERLAVTLRSIGEGVITTDTVGNVVLVNKVAEDLTGWTQNAAAGQPLHKVFSVVDAASRMPCGSITVDALTDAGNSLSRNKVLISKNGRERQIADNAGAIRDSEGSVIGVVVVFTDITDQLAIERELLKVAKLNSIGVLAGGIAHDFNNILMGILGNLNLAAMNASGDERLLGWIKEAEKASLRAKGLTQQLLTFSKGGQPIKEVVSLSEVIRESTTFALHGKNVECRFDIPGDLWLVDVDTGQMGQVVQNLVINSCQAMPEGGVIEITCENVPHVYDDRVLSSRRENYVRIRMHDTGGGIDPDIIDKIFDPFFSTKREGSGLGLAITHSIIAKHNGTIYVESGGEEGTTFTIYLPATPAEKKQEAVSDAALKQASGKILIMDDEQVVRDVVLRMLEHLGCSVLMAQDGEEAISLFIESRDKGMPVDAVIMDLTIPNGMGGKEAVARILDIDPQAKVIVSSGYSNDPVMSNYKEYGFCDAVAKPFQISELAEVLNSVLQG